MQVLRHNTIILTFIAHILYVLNTLSPDPPWCEMGKIGKTSGWLFPTTYFSINSNSYVCSFFFLLMSEHLVHTLSAFQTTAKLGIRRMFTCSHMCKELVFWHCTVSFERLCADKISWRGWWECSYSWSCSSLLSLGPFG
jgi:hypothetical protein